MSAVDTLVPEEAVQTIDGKPCVFVAEKEENTFSRHEISAGPAVGEYVPVLRGLEEGQRIVTRGSFVLKAELGKGSGEE